MAISCKIMLLGFCVFGLVSLVSSANFSELFEPSWALDHVAYDGEQLKLKLDNYSGAGFGSKSKYMFGKTTVQIKLVEGSVLAVFCALFHANLIDEVRCCIGVNVCSQMSSDGPNHNEFDFEFLGNTTGEPYLVQTNIYINGVGNREQRLSLWFDPSKDFHAYSILLESTPSSVLVDETPIRVYKQKEKKGVPFPKDQAMGIYSSIWNADDWATQGGRVKTDWSHAPFVASYKGFDINGCECPVSTNVVDNAKKCSSTQGKYWWDQPVMAELNLHQSHQLMWVQAKHMIYDYCTDTSRFPVTPAECEHRRW
ncbi:hypothetical protein IFM89_022674 [Coptis chinensis]|uniref:Xyloglucan endotransglucosylase/hydrolase n=1 Tax=Coptis chinensis TaxID=261450 RepID=A0A835H0J0_9MAGN|nr:hypothetical protein IFM89_022674 [Coptis chinensis]